MRNYLSILSSLALASATAQAQPAEPAPAEEPPQPPPAETPVSAEPPPPPPAEAPPKLEEKPPANAGYDKGFFLRSDSGKFALKITGRVQPFYNLTRTEGPPKNVANNFEIRRARLTLDGHAHTKRLQYKMQSDFGKGFVTLKDFHVDLGLAPDVWLRAGQWKRPFSRQQITSSGKLEITDRSITDKAFGAGRDIGLAIMNPYEKSPAFEWVVGVFNGTGDGSKITSTTEIDPVTMEAETTTGLPTNVPKEFRPAIVGRIGINRGGIKGYSEADLEGGPLRYGVGASVLLEGDFDDNDQSNQKVELDFIVKNQGLSATGGVYAMTEQDGSGVLDATRSLFGFHVQAGYMVVPKHWQLAARYAFVSDLASDAKTARDQQEVALGANYFGFGHDAKIVTALRLFKTADAALTDHLLFELGANVAF